MCNVKVVTCDKPTENYQPPAEPILQLKPLLLWIQSNQCQSLTDFNERDSDKLTLNNQPSTK